MGQAHKALSDSENASDFERPEIAAIAIPDKAHIWFSLPAFIQSQPEMKSLPLALLALLDELSAKTKALEAAIDKEDTKEIKALAQSLLPMAEGFDSEAITYLMQSILDDCQNGLSDNLSIRWPATKKSMQHTLRVIYSHLHLG